MLISITYIFFFLKDRAEHAHWFKFRAAFCDTDITKKCIFETNMKTSMTW